jgi:hypothetical protein
MESIANEAEVQALAKAVASYLEARQQDLHTNGEWTDAVYEALKLSASGRGWTIYPVERAKKGEYLLDFMLTEPAYGVRVACESQWFFKLNNSKASREWAFDNLIGVKGDIKLYVHEDGADEFSETATKYLSDYALLTPSEAFVDLRWDNDKFHCRWWKPASSGKQDKIEFVTLDL